MKLITIAQLIVSVALIIAILLQNRGAGLSMTFGGEMGGYYTKRGLEKFLFKLSVVLAITFIILSAVSTYYSGRL